MIKVLNDGHGGLMFSTTDEKTGQTAVETMSAPDARKFAREITEICNVIEGWDWMPGGGPVQEPVIHDDNAWYPINEPPRETRSVLITTEDAEGRYVVVGLYLPERKNTKGKTLPARWLVPALGVDVDGVHAQEKLIAWSPIPMPSKRGLPER